MIEPNSAPRSLVWSPMRWMISGEVLVLALAAQLAFSLQFIDPPLASVPWQLVTALGFGLAMGCVLHALGMHDVRSRQRALQVLLKYVTAAAAGAALLWMLLAANGSGAVKPGALGSALAIGFLLIAVWRVFVQLLIDSSSLRRNVLVLGSGRRAQAFHNLLRRRSDRRGLEIVGYVPLGKSEGTQLPAARMVHTRTPLRRFCERNQVKEVVIAGDNHRGELPLRELMECRFHGIAVTPAASFVERECGRIPVELVEPSWWIYRRGFERSAITGILKRGFDLVTGALILVMAAPLMLLSALAIRVEGGAGCTVLFRQTRVGMGGCEFRLIKFRSMREDAESDGVARWASTNDDRVTRVGRFLRKTRLDELPQLFNVMRGEMSLVGPRPERPEFVGDLARQIPWYEERHLLRPGITGWAQLCYPYGASARDALEKLKFDLYYIKNHSLLFDIAILMRTVEVVLFGKGAR